jgi:hypothetical protein
MCDCLTKETASMTEFFTGQIKKKVKHEITILEAGFTGVQINPATKQPAVSLPFSIRYKKASSKKGKEQVYNTSVIPLYCQFCGQPLTFLKDAK